MKKIVSTFLALVMFLGLASSAQAAGAINPDEQRILDELAIGVNAGGTRLHVAASDMAQAENVLKGMDATKAQADTVVQNIVAARELVEAQGISANSLPELMKLLPANVVEQLKGFITNAANALGLKVGFTANGIYLIDEKGTTVYQSNTGSNPIVKQTGANYTVSLVTAVTLAVASLGAAVLGKKYAHA